MIFAVINMVITSLLIIGIIIGTIIFNVTLYKAQHPTDVAILDNVYQYMDKGSQNSRDVLIINAILGGSVFIIILHFAFSAVLINGLSKQKSEQVKIFFIYGVFINVLSYGVFAILPILVIIPLIFTSILVMIYMTYTKMENMKAYGLVVNNYRVPLVAA